MNLETMRHLKEQDQNLKVGDAVIVRWGYGLGFRVEAEGVIVKLSQKSLQVQLIQDVQLPNSNTVGWPAGFVLKGIPRWYRSFDNQWNYWNSITPKGETV